jgi:hypothetical protein
MGLHPLDTVGFEHSLVVPLNEIGIFATLLR